MSRNIGSDAKATAAVLFGSASSLMALSFGIYSAYPVVPFLPISGWSKVRVAMGLSASWGMFFVGSVLVGKKGKCLGLHRVRHLAVQFVA